MCADAGTGRVWTTPRSPADSRRTAVRKKSRRAHVLYFGGGIYADMLPSPPMVLRLEIESRHGYPQRDSFLQQAITTHQCVRYSSDYEPQRTH